MEVAQLLQAPVVRRVQLQREFFIPRTDDLVKGTILIVNHPQINYKLLSPLFKINIISVPLAIN